MLGLAPKEMRGGPMGFPILYIVYICFIYPYLVIFEEKKQVWVGTVYLQYTKDKSSEPVKKIARGISVV